MNFIEIQPPDTTPKKPDRIKVFTVDIPPKECGSFLKELSKVLINKKDEALAHLKRVKRERRPQPQPHDEQQQATKKAKVEDRLRVLLGLAQDDTGKFDDLVKSFGLTINETEVPGRPAESQEELQDFNKLWPTLYFHKQTKQHKQEELELTDEDISLMKFGMNFLQEGGEKALIVCPKTRGVISKASDEASSQGSISEQDNPLCTPAILAIQGVSRKERDIATGHGMSSTTFQKGQYLCNGYDAFLENEPTVFEAMALVHSRIRRVVFRHPNHRDGGLGGSGDATAVHFLPGTNHHYRAFRCDVDEGADC